MKKHGIRFLVLLIISCSTIVAKAADEAADEVKQCSILFCKEDAKKFIVFESDGTWMDAVRWLELSVKDGQAAAKLTLWRGMFKPTKPDTQIRTIAQIQSVPTAEFQKAIDDLQNTQTSGVLNKKE